MSTGRLEAAKTFGQLLMFAVLVMVFVTAPLWTMILVYGGLTYLGVGDPIPSFAAIGTFLLVGILALGGTVEREME